jgi:hypothetical protein
VFRAPLGDLDPVSCGSCHRVDCAPAMADASASPVSFNTFRRASLPEQRADLLSLKEADELVGQALAGMASPLSKSSMKAIVR